MFWRFFSIYWLAPLSLLAICGASAQQARLESRTDEKQAAAEKTEKAAKNGKRTVWNLDGGVFFSTDGHLPNGSCFRLQGQMVAPDFFEGLRRVDTDQGSSYLLRDKLVTQYPEQVQVVLHLLDFPCSPNVKDTAARPPLTRELMSTLRLNFAWKNGLHMRPVEEAKRIAADIQRMGSYVKGAAAQELAPRFEWNYAFTVNTAGVPLTDDLVLVIENPDHSIAARVSARL